KWAIAVVKAGEDNDLVMLPTGAGEARTLPRTAVVYQSVNFFPDGRRVLASGHEPGQGTRLYVLDVSGGRPRAITGEGVSIYGWRPVSPDGRLTVALAADGTLMLYPTEGGDPRPLPGVSADELPIRWSADGQSLYVARGVAAPLSVDLVDAATGTRRPWKTITPPDPAGVLQIGPLQITADGQSYVYSYRRQLDELVVVTGLK